MAITGKTLIGWGIEPGPHYPAAIAAANAAIENGEDPKAAAMSFQPTPKLKNQNPESVKFGKFIGADNTYEVENLRLAEESMRELAKTPVVKSMAIMPDACPAGPKGTICVGGVAESSAIHPGMHSADICCSVAISVIGDVDPKEILDRAHKVTHFGPGGRTSALLSPTKAILDKFRNNRFLKSMEEEAVSHFGTQGDGNHFFFVGRLASTGDVAIVTHHGSRKPGAMLYKKGMAAANKLMSKIAPETQKVNAWLDPDSQDGQDYWEALQIIREWTKDNHEVIHEMVLNEKEPIEKFWNEHNFVFKRGDSYFHGKGATPAWEDYAEDSCGKVLIPLNMAAPVLIAKGRDKSDALGFCPHGAGRNMSRTMHKKITGGMHDNLDKIDVRWYLGNPDTSEMPSAYKPAEKIIKEIEEFGLADIVDKVEPYGSIMAGSRF